MKHILFPTLGSAGDVAPLIALGQALNRPGFQAHIIASPVFRTMVEQAGIDFLPLGSEQQFTALVGHPDLYHPTRAFSVVVRLGVLPFLRPLLDLIRNFPKQDTLIVSPLLLFASHVAYEKDQIPFVTLQLQPSLLRSVYAPPVLGSTPLPGWFPPGLVSFYYRMLDKFLIDPILAPELNTFRNEMGLPPIRRVFDRHLFSPIRNICLFPRWYAQPQPDWPANTVCTGFISAHGNPEPLSPQLQAFLDAGVAPLVFTAGTSTQQPEAFFQTAIAATKQLNRRAVLITRHSAPALKDLPQNILHQPYADFSLLLPHADVFVYHGGIGSLAQAVAAGVPQLVIPMSNDQPDNAERVRRLGVGDCLSGRSFNAATLARKLTQLTTSEEIRATCSAYAQKIDFTAALEQTCREILTCL